jgi:hypothetical protein
VHLCSSWHNRCCHNLQPLLRPLLLLLLLALIMLTAFLLLLLHFAFLLGWLLL